MSAREILLSDLVGRTVLDVDGQRIGRIMELHAEIELHEHGNDYVVREFHVGVIGGFEAFGGSRFARMAMKRLGAKLRSYTIPWELMDLGDPEHPRARTAKGQLHLDVDG